MDTNVSEEYAAPIFRVEVSVVRIWSELARNMVTHIHGSERGDRVRFKPKHVDREDRRGIFLGNIGINLCCY
jgi:hypothetical protein